MTLVQEKQRPSSKMFRRFLILMAEDDEDDRLLTRDALKESKLPCDLRFVKDGEELMDYLLHRGIYDGPDLAPPPGLILLDLNMPRKDGREALKEIEAYPNLRRIPIVVLTTSKAEEDILSAYQLGVNTYIRKPVQFRTMVETVKMIGKYWFEIAELPLVVPRDEPPGPHRRNAT